MDYTLRQRLLQLTQKCEQLSKNSKYNECIQIMQQIIGIKKQVYGMDHLQFQKASQKLCDYLNLAAMIYLQKQKLDICLDYLRKAQLVARNSIQYKATTFNNLACYYRRTGKIRTALSYLIQALQLQLKLEHPKTLADTHLNLCAVLSQLDRHQDALQHVMLSIILLQDQFLAKLLPQSNLQSIESDNNNQVKNKKQKINDQRLAVLAIAYHNMGVQFQHMKRYQQAVKIYKKALNISKTYLFQNQQLIQNLTRVVNSATDQIQDKKKYTSEARRQKIDKQFSQTKYNIYKQFAKQSQRAKNLPKLKINKQQFQLRQSLNQTPYTHSRQKDNVSSNNSNVVQKMSRDFQSRKHPKYYKSYAVPSSSQNRGLVSQQSRQRPQYGAVAVSDGLKDFNPT